MPSTSATSCACSQRCTAAPPQDRTQQRQALLDTLSGEPHLRSKKALIEAFIDEHLPKLSPEDDVHTAFQAFWEVERRQAFQRLCTVERFHPERLRALVERYLFAEQLPSADQLLGALEARPGLLDSLEVGERLEVKFKDFVGRFYEGVDLG